MDQSLGAAAVHTNGYAHVIFTLTETVNFEISGAFSGGGSRDSTTQYLLVANLANTSSGYLYDEYEQTPQNATGALLFPNNRQDYVGSDYGNAYQQLTGGLAPGVYQFYQAGSLYDPTPDAGTVAARGFTQLRLWVDPPGGGDPVPAVPEPSSLVIFGLGALCCLGPLDCGSHKHCMTNRRFSRQPRWLLLDSRESLSLLAGLAGGPPWRRTKLA